ncbi:alpha-N-acetylgalactosaminide alpha-2,6-sialyltransferase 2-like [Rhinatrema bivittatum]|uniref:alpha-N-acetylgalactosaminide alpha-2,6-sialyltransferase 2-like n=1 Tax=Rhinatrema bivittatum TaxID=194408 RepID=UPI00112A469F|nr:alpha-N-acetylgalactosaminide alpha-2,6-sialyltransferase 2-like [Rhinatrema bivittatum]
MNLCFRVRAQKLKLGVVVIIFSVIILLFVNWWKVPALTDLSRARTSPRRELKSPPHENKMEQTQKRTTRTENGKAAVGKQKMPTAAVQPRATRKAMITPDKKALFLNQSDQYGEDVTYVNRTCPDTIRTRIAGTQLQPLFLPRIPVLQWKKHATREEHERLRKHGGAQGWMDVEWNILNETLNLLNSSANGYMFDDWQQRHPANPSCIRCAVVGNGGILNGSKVGAEIDQHDYVFRVNAAILKEFEEDVGKRTSFYVFSSNTMINSLSNYESDGFRETPKSMETRYVFVPDHDMDYLLLKDALTQSKFYKKKNMESPAFYFGKDLRKEKFKMLHPDFMRYLMNRFLWDSILTTEDKDVYRVSTGAAMLLAAIHTCDQVSAYGFITPDYDKYSEHYYDKIYKEFIFYSNHNFKLEMELWQKLHKNGIIKLHSRQ